MKNDLTKVSQFEKELDKALENLQSIQFNGDNCIVSSLQAIEHCYSKGMDGYSLASVLKKGFDVLVPYFIKSKSEEEVDLAVLIEDLLFASKYYLIREYLYYTYNSEDSLLWSFDINSITIKFNDLTIPRQFASRFNNFLVISEELFSNKDKSKKIRKLLKGRKEFDIHKNNIDAADLCCEEANLKLSKYYNFLHKESDLSLGKYTYNQFYIVYEALLTKALYHRYYAQFNYESGTPIIININELLEGFEIENNIPPNITTEILNDISFGLDSNKFRIPPMTFALYKINNGQSIVMSPNSFCLWEGLLSILKIVATKNSKLFLSTISNHLSKNFTNHIQKMFESNGFHCLSEVKLSKIDPKLPDIDLMVISVEKTLGYVVYCCELKNPIPPIWSKDYLKVLEKDNVSKGFKQIDHLKEFFSSDTGIAFLHDKLPKVNNPVFSDGFITLINYLIITSNNSGMFFDNMDTNIIDYTTLEIFLKNIDGDMNYFMHLINEYKENIDKCYSIETSSLTISDMLIKFEGVTIKNIFNVERNSYRSAGIDEMLALDFAKEGLKPFDSLKDFHGKTE